MVLLMLAGSFHAVAGSKSHGENRIAIDQAARTILAQDQRRIARRGADAVYQSRVLLTGNARMNNGSADGRCLHPFRRSTSAIATQPRGFGPGGHRRLRHGAKPDHRGWFLLKRVQYGSLLDPPTVENAGPVV
jgi:hypothetical protein